MAKEIAFAELIRKHQGLLFKVTSIYTDNKTDREDLFQEVVYQLWTSFDSFRNESKISTWMFRIAMNTAITQLKKRKRRPDAIPISDTILSHSQNVDENYEERLRTLYNYIEQLDVLEKGVMLLLLEGKSYKEIAEITGLSDTNVGTRISRIKKKLRTNMTKS